MIFLSIINIMVRLISILFILFNLTLLSSQSLSASFYASEYTIYVDDLQTAFKLIELDRADYYVGPYVYHRVFEINPEFSNISLLEPPVFVLDTFIALHKKHKELEPAISETIKALAESGRTGEVFGNE